MRLNKNSPKMLPVNLPALQKKLPANTVTLSPISGADMFYTDGLASSYQYRLEIKEGPALKYSAYINAKEFASCSIMPKNDPYGNIIHEWLAGIPKENQNQNQAQAHAQVQPKPQPGR